MKLFSKYLTATDCLKRLSIPEWVLAFLPDFQGGHAVELQVVCETREWSIVCTTRKKGYKKPVLSRGWRKFVVGNSLSVGDELTLHKEEEDDETMSLRYRVEVKRANNCGPCKARSRRNKLVIGKRKRGQMANCTDHDQKSEHQFGIVVDGPTNETKNARETVDGKQFGLTVGNSNDQVGSLGADTHDYGAKEEKAVTLEHLGLGLTADDALMVQFTHDDHVTTNDQKLGSEEFDMILGQSIRSGGSTVNLDLTLASY